MISLPDIPHNSFPYHPYQTSWCKFQANVLTPQGLNMVCGESNETNGEKIVLSLTAEKKIVCF